jgi:hypothetical protein
VVWESGFFLEGFFLTRTLRAATMVRGLGDMVVGYCCSGCLEVGGEFVLMSL